MRIRAIISALAAAVLLTACAGGGDLSQPPEEFGDFALGYNIVVAKNAKAVGPSRKATAVEWETALTSAIAARMGRYEGEKLYHIGISVDAYALAVPGVPLVLSPKSVLAITANVWDDTAGRKINAEPRRFTVLEQLSGETLVGSGLTQSKEEQMANLSANAARLINEWLVENSAWFTPEAVAGRAVMVRAADAPAAAN